MSDEKQPDSAESGVSAGLEPGAVLKGSDLTPDPQWKDAAFRYEGNGTFVRVFEFTLGDNRPDGDPLKLSGTVVAANVDEAMAEAQKRAAKNAFGVSVQAPTELEKNGAFGMDRYVFEHDGDQLVRLTHFHVFNEAGDKTNVYAKDHDDAAKRVKEADASTYPDGGPFSGTVRVAEVKPISDGFMFTSPDEIKAVSDKIEKHIFDFMATLPEHERVLAEHVMNVGKGLARNVLQSGMHPADFFEIPHGIQEPAGFDPTDVGGDWVELGEFAGEEPAVSPETFALGEAPGTVQQRRALQQLQGQLREERAIQRAQLRGRNRKVTAFLDVVAGGLYWLLDKVEGKGRLEPTGPFVQQLKPRRKRGLPPYHATMHQPFMSPFDGHVISDFGPPAVAEAVTDGEDPAVGTPGEPF